MRAGVALVVLGVVTACWSEGPGAAPPPLRPEPTEPPPARKPVWRPGREAAAPTPPDPARTPEQLAVDLSNELRANAALLTTYIAGPIVVLDLDAGTLTVACDATALAGAQTWGQHMADPALPRPRCRGFGTFTCSQYTAQEILIVELADPDQWRIVSVIAGNFRNGRTTMNTKIGQMRALLASATCP